MSTRCRLLPSCVLCIAAVVGCQADRLDVDSDSFPGAGLYTPGSALGAVADDPMEEGLGERCNPLPPPAAGSITTSGELEVKYTTQSLDGRYAPRNCSAVWIEDMAGQYVATIELAAGLRKPGLVYFQDHACTDRLGPDVVTSATLADHEKPHTATWGGLDSEKKPVADGQYKLFIEVTESDKEPGELSEFMLDKGPTPFAMEAPVEFEGPLAQVTLTWKVKAATAGSGGGGAGGGAAGTGGGGAGSGGN